MQHRIPRENKNRKPLRGVFKLLNFDVSSVDGKANMCVLLFIYRAVNLYGVFDFIFALSIRNLVFGYE